MESKASGGFCFVDLYIYIWDLFPSLKLFLGSNIYNSLRSSFPHFEPLSHSATPTPWPKYEKALVLYLKHQTVAFNQKLKKSIHHTTNPKNYPQIPISHRPRPRLSKQSSPSEMPLVLLLFHLEISINR